MERQTASSSASCSPSTAASSSSACGGKRRSDFLNMFRVRLNPLARLLPLFFCLMIIRYPCVLVSVSVLILQFLSSSFFFLSNEASSTLLWIKITPKFSTKTIRQRSISALHTTSRQFVVQLRGVIRFSYEFTDLGTITLVDLWSGRLLLFTREG